MNTEAYLSLAACAFWLTKASRAKSHRRAVTYAFFAGEQWNKASASLALWAVNKTKLAAPTMNLR